MSGQAQNTDKEIWREREGDYYADKIFVTENGGIGLDCGGHCIVLPIRQWFALADGTNPPQGFPTSGSLSELLQEEMNATIHLPADSARGDGGLTYIDGLLKAIAIVREHEAEDGPQYPYVMIGKYNVAAYPEYIWIGLDGDGEGCGFDEAKLEAVIDKFYGENF